MVQPDFFRGQIRRLLPHLHIPRRPRDRLGLEVRTLAIHPRCRQLLPQLALHVGGQGAFALRHHRLARFVRVPFDRIRVDIHDFHDQIQQFPDRGLNEIGLASEIQSVP